MYEGPVQDLVEELGRLPGIGPKSAQRLAFHLLHIPADDARRLARAIVEARERISWCRRCFNLAAGELCRICADDRRDVALLCVVEDPRDIVAIERTGGFRGRYHVLQGAISPIEGIGPEQLRVKELLERVGTEGGERGGGEGIQRGGGEGIQEVILATNPNIEGEATALYLVRVLKPFGVYVTRLASGLPVGGDLEYADEVTLGRAFEGRRPAEAD